MNRRPLRRAAPAHTAPPFLAPFGAVLAGCSSPAPPRPYEGRDTKRRVRQTLKQVRALGWGIISSSLKKVTTNEEQPLKKKTAIPKGLPAVVAGV